MRMMDLPKMTIEEIASIATASGQLQLVSFVHPWDQTYQMYAVIRGERELLNVSTDLRTATKMFVGRIGEEG